MLFGKRKLMRPPSSSVVLKSRRKLIPEQPNFDWDQPWLHTRSKLPLDNVPIEEFETQLARCDPDVSMSSREQEQDEENEEFIRFLREDLPDDDDDVNDPEYTYQDPVDTRDKDEFRLDRATKIPPREVESLLQDLLSSDYVHHPMAAVSPTASSVHDGLSTPGIAAANDRQIPVNDAPTYTSLQPMTTQTSAPPSTKTEPSTPPTADVVMLQHRQPSVCLIQEEGWVPTLLSTEMQQLQLQMRQHVQLLMQLNILSEGHNTLDLRDVHNKSKNLLNEVQNLVDSMQTVDLDVFNLPHAFTTIERFNDKQNVQVNADDYPQRIADCKWAMEMSAKTKGGHNNPRNLPVPSLRCRVILSHSLALVDPDLLPLSGPDLVVQNQSRLQYTCPSAVWLLGLGAHQFRDINRKSKKSVTAPLPGVINFALIRQLLLPTYGAGYLRDRFNRAMRPTGPQTEEVIMLKHLQTTGDLLPLPTPVVFCPNVNALQQPIKWPEHRQPKWLMYLNNFEHKRPLYTTAQRGVPRPERAKVWWKYIQRRKQTGRDRQTRFPKPMVDRACSPVQWGDNHVQNATLINVTHPVTAVVAQPIETSLEPGVEVLRINDSKENVIKALQTLAAMAKEKFDD